MTRILRPRVLLAAALLLLTGLPLAVDAADLTVSAAASLTNAFRELGPVFEARHPGTRVQFNFAASGALLQQIAKGAPVDVFASADQETMDDAQKQGLVDAPSRIDFVRNALVVIVPADSRQNATGLADLRSERFAKVAIGQPASVPVGRYTKAVLEQAGLWATVEPRMIGAQSVRQALDYVARGEVDAGFVYATDAAIMSDKVRVLFTVPTPTPILYPMAVLKGSPNEAVARTFVRFIASPAVAGGARALRLRRALMRDATRRRVLRAVLSIALAALHPTASAAGPGSPTVAIGGLVARPTTFAVEDLAKRATRDVFLDGDAGGPRRTWRGATLRDLLAACEPIEHDRFDLRRSDFVARATDGDLAVFSWAEVFNSAIGDDVVVAYALDGAPLGDAEGPIALVSGGDTRKGPRHVRWLTSIDVRRVVP